MVPLANMLQGSSATISKMHGKRQNEVMAPMGIRVGKEIEMLRNGESGPVLLKVDESRIAIGRGMAQKIMVEEK